MIETSSVQSVVHQNSDTHILKVARGLEAAFVSEMLKSTGLGEVSSSFGGGAGESQFASFLRNEQAKQITDAGGLGLTQEIFNAIMDAKNAKD